MAQERMQRQRTDIVEMFVIYEHAHDYPNNRFVVRRWWISGPDPEPTEDCRIAFSLRDIRDLVPPGCVCLTRCPGDDPCIVEVWI